MNRSMNWTRGLLIALAFAVLNTGAFAAVAQDITDQNVAERIVQAKTPADHQAISVYYQTQANAAAAKVKEHEAMVKAYGGHGSKTMNRHCEALLQTYRGQQKDLEALAKDHAEMAKAAAK